MTLGADDGQGVEATRDAPVRPARVISLDRAVRRDVSIGDHTVPVWMVGDMDALIDAYISSQHEDADLKERCPFGATLWPSGRAFARWIEGRLPEALKAPGAEVLELGSGVGFGATWLARLGVPHVLATDYEPAFSAFVARNAQEAGVAGRVGFRALDWTRPLPADLSRRFPCIVACDVLYEDLHITHLPRIARDALADDGTFFLADPERYRYARALEELHRAFGRIEDVVVETPSEDHDATSGVVSARSRLTRVHILRCTRPRRNA